MIMICLYLSKTSDAFDSSWAGAEVSSREESTQKNSKSDITWRLQGVSADSGGVLLRYILTERSCHMLKPSSATGLKGPCLSSFCCLSSWPPMEKCLCQN